MGPHLSTRVRQQLIDIWVYTAKNWGELKGNDYIDNLYKAFNDIQNKPYLWKKVSYKKLDTVFCFRYEQHIVFFNLLDDRQIEVISILHQRMNLPARLLKALKQEDKTP